MQYLRLAAQEGITIADQDVYQTREKPKCISLIMEFNVGTEPTLWVRTNWLVVRLPQWLSRRAIARLQAKEVSPRSEQAPATTSRQPEGLKPERESDSTPEHLLRQGIRSGKTGERRAVEYHCPSCSCPELHKAGVL